jgi:putative ABC transport system substrate-binding protein
MSYAANFAKLHRETATYVDKNLKGSKPADLPVQQPTTIEPITNSRPPRRSGSPCHHRCSPAPMS